MAAPSPRELALFLLRHRFGTDTDNIGTADELAAFQREAVVRLQHALDRYGGALLADSVGLGKTHVGAAIVRDAVRRGGSVVVIVPTSLVRQWKRALRGVREVHFTTHACLSRGGAAIPKGASLLVIDEAHAFRNPAARRYRALARLAEERSVLLITATPVNNSLWDLYWLLRLFARDDAFAHVGVPDLLTCIREAQRTARFSGLPAVLGEVAVRRTRDMLHQAGMRTSRGNISLTFPRRARPREIAYDVPPGLMRELLGCIEQLRLAPWCELGDSASGLLLRMVLLKRLESSHAAFAASLRRMLALLQRFRSALAAGRLLTPAEHRSQPFARGDQLVLEELLLRPLPRHLDATALDEAARSDVALCERMLAQMAIHRDISSKSIALESVLSELAPRPVLVFTEFRETAEHLWTRLRARHATALIHGSAAFLGSSSSSRRVVVDRFAPLSNNMPPPPLREAVRILVATDVLAEGLNLQDAADLVSYDLPWNPVRLLQRMGRIDRLGSPHAEVRGYYFRPHVELDELLGLMRRLRAKLAAIRGAVGEESAVVAAGANAATPVRPGIADAPTRGRPRARARRATDEWFVLEERLRTAFAAADAAEKARDVKPMILRLGAAAAPAVRGASAGAVLLFFELGGRLRPVVLRRGRPARDDRLTSDVLIGALDRPEPSATLDAATGARLIRRAANALSVSDPRRPARQTAALRRRLLATLQACPGGPTPAECRRADALLDLLTGSLPVSAELTLRTLQHRPRLEFAVLAAAIEAAIGRGEPAGADSRGPQRARFLGGFVFD